MSFFGAEGPMIDTWIEEKLMVTSSGALEALSTGLSSRVYPDVAPSTAAYPFIVYQQQTPPEVIRGVGSAEVMVDTIYVVKAINQGTSDAALAPVANAIRDALVFNNGEGIVGGIGTIFTSHYVRAFRMSSVEQASQFRHLGGVFRIQARAA